MTNSRFPLPFIGPSFVEARVKSCTAHDTASGDRIYAVFKAVDGSTLGLWSHADHPALRTLRVGDTVVLTRNSKGHLKLASQPASRANLIGIFALLLRPWRLI
ncbi:MAG: hypothetical protein AAF327_04045 [Cyanobacteria bacterium P01_A01_bin.37]